MRVRQYVNGLEDARSWELKALGIAGVSAAGAGLRRGAADRGRQEAMQATAPAWKTARPRRSILAELERRLAEKGVALGTPLMIRIFKMESELEVWVEKGSRFELFATYPICNWSGVLGPKQTEGDRQSPEGLYSIGLEQLHRRGRWRRSLDIGYPNTFDKAHGRTGSFILVHGGCATIGCFAMTDRKMDEIYALSELP